MGIGKIQISDPSREVIEYAHSKGIVVNIYYADDPEKAREYLDMGADVILSNNILRIMPVVECIMQNAKCKNNR